MGLPLRVSHASESPVTAIVHAHAPLHPNQHSKTVSHAHMKQVYADEVVQVVENLGHLEGD